MPYKVIRISVKRKEKRNLLRMHFQIIFQSSITEGIAGGFFLVSMLVLK